MSDRRRKSATADPYATLGVDRRASPDEIRKAYRRKAKRAHPDVGGSTAEFADLNKAMGVLIDPIRRLAFDTTGAMDDAPPPNDKMGAAMSIIDSMVQQILNGKDDPLKIDVVQTMKDFATNAIVASQKQIRDFEKQAKKIEAVAARFRRRTGDNFIKRMLEHRVAGIRAQIAVSKRDQENLRQVETILADYHFDFDREPQQQTAMYLQMSFVTRGAGATA